MALSQTSSAILSLVAIPGANELFQVSPHFALEHVQQFRGFYLPSSRRTSADAYNAVQSNSVRLLRRKNMGLDSFNPDSAMIII